ncbi:MAG: type IX secretion system outer membrane channel protein PorV [Bacteroidales bacterium]|nr:type IX secretion system outer membrane channel protein PorV [Bacteroidales bacterium]
MPFWLRKIAIVLILLLIGGNLLAQIGIDPGDDGRIRLSGGNIITAVPFLLISPDARASGMGDAGVASSPDVNSQHWNPAKFAFINDDFGISLTYTPWLRMLVRDMNLLYLAGYYRLDNNWVVGASMRYFSLGEVTFRTGPLDPGIIHRPHEYAFDISLSRRLTEHFSLAVSGRYIRSDLTSGFTDPTSTSRTRAANSGAVDVSMFYTRDIVRGREPSSFALGLNISNIGAKISYSEAMERDFLPANLRLGGSYTRQIDRYNEITVMMDFNKLLVPTPLAPGDSISQNPRELGVIESIFNSLHVAPGGFREKMQEIKISFGIEYTYNQIFSVRAGYFHEHRNKGGRQYFTVGAGLRFNVFEIDFAYLLPRANNIASAVNPLRNTMRFSLRFNFAEHLRRQNA